MGHLDLFAIHQQSGTGGTHARKALITGCQVIDNGVGTLDFVGEVYAAGTVKVGVVQRGQVQNGGSGSDVTTDVPAHAVSNNSKITPTVPGVVILAAFHARIGTGFKAKGYLQRLPPQLHSRSAHTEIDTRLNSGSAGQLLVVYECAVG